MRWALALLLACELAAFALLARQGLEEAGRSGHAWSQPQWLAVIGIAALCGLLGAHWRVLWRAAAWSYAGLEQGRDGTGRPGILLVSPSGGRAVARVDSSWEMGDLALVLALEPVSGQPPRVLVVSQAHIDGVALRALKRTLRAARRERLATGGAG